MPTAPFNTLCSTLGCKQPRSKVNGFCIDHGGKDYIPSTTAGPYRTPAWRSIRRAQLSKQSLCQGCLSRGKVEMAEHVDHVWAWRHIGQQAFRANAFQSLCEACHSHKTGQERQGVYLHYKGGDEPISHTLSDYVKFNDASHQNW